MRRARRDLVSIAILVSVLSPARALAQTRPEADDRSPVIAAGVSIRDGDVTWSVRRDEGDARSVLVSRASGPSFRARIDEHALVRIAPGHDTREVLRELELELVREVSRRLGAYRVVDARGGDGLELAARLAAHAGPGRPLIDAIPDWLLPHRARAIDVPPDDPRYPGQWYLDRIGIEDAWRLSSGDPATTIVIVDSGCDASHPDLAPNLDPGRDVLAGDDDPSPEGDSHGTSCAGLAAAATDNATGIAGTCPECRLRCVRLLSGDPATEVPISADVEAFQFALDVDAAVVSNSWGFVEATPIPSSLRAIIEAVVDEGRGGLGALVLFASGNDNRELFDYEIDAVRGVITVGAVNNFDEVTAFSNRGASVDVVAPTGTLTTDLVGAGGADPGDYTSSFGGTSSSCPIAAGVAGLLASAAPSARGDVLASALISTARPSPYATPDETGHDLYYGYGRIAPAAALREVLGIPEPIDAGLEPDAGALDGGIEEAPPSGCACRAAPRRGSGALGLVAAAALLALRRRRIFTSRGGTATR